MKDFETIRAVKRSASERLFAIRGVHCVAAGPKKTGGKPTGENAILVYVTRKKPLGALEPEEVIPAEIDGVKVDVVESPMPTLLVDMGSYDPLRGGIQIQSGGDRRGEGTLGFLAQSSDGQKIYAVTSHHVLLLTHSLTSDLSATVNPKDSFATSVTITFKGPLLGSIDVGTVVGVRILAAPAQQGSLQRFAVVLSTPSGAHESDVAIKVRDELNATGLVNATQSGPSVTITPGATLSKIDVSCQTFGKKITESSGLDASVTGNVIKFTGQASDSGGAFVNFNIGGPNPSFGLFVPIAGGDDATTVATSTLSGLTALQGSDRLKTQLSGLSLQRTDAQVTIGGAEEVECDITKDDRVGQPDNTFCCRHHKCCSSRIGLVVATALDLDLALIRLDGEQKYIAKVEEIPENGGAVFGTADAKLGDAVQKRGRTSGRTDGTVSGLDADGLIGFKSKSWPNPTFFHRYYRNAIRIDNTADDFSQSGDSGSAIMDKQNHIVGLLFGGGGEGSGYGLATPIATVLDAFKTLDVVVATTTDPATAKTVPGPSFNFTALPADQTVSPIVGGTPLFESLRKAEVEIEAIPAGKEISAAVRRHVNEGFQLVTTNKRVGAVWKRNGGQQILPALLRTLHNPASRLPDEIGGRHLSECLTNIRRIFERYGSPGFVADLKRSGDQLIRLMSVNYEEMLLALRSGHQP